MPYTTFTELYDAVVARGREGDFAAAYTLIAAEGSQFPDDASTVLYLHSCMAERVGKRAEALATLTAALDQGHWYGEQLLRNSPSWQPLQGDPDFERLVARSLALRDAALRDAALRAPLPLVAQPEGMPPPGGWPLLLALHGNAGTRRNAFAGWQAAAKGWLLAALQSSQALSDQQFVWDDREQSRRDVLSQFATLRATYPVDDHRIVLAGFSRGAESALELALLGALHVRGVVLLAPGGPLTTDPERWLPHIRGSTSRELRAAVVIGDDDDSRRVDSALQLAPLLDDNGIPCHLEIVQGLGHAYPQDGGAALQRGLAFVSR